MIEIYSTSEADKWDSIVRSMKEYDVYYLSGYVKAFELNGDGKAYLIYVHSKDTRLIQVIMKRDISSVAAFECLGETDKYYDIVTPYGYGGILVEGHEIQAVLQEYSEFCVNNGIVCEFVRFNPITENALKLKGFYEVIELGNTVYIDTSDEEIIWKNISSKNRNMIRKAQKMGVKVYYGKEPWMIDNFIEIYNHTMDRDNASAYYYFEKNFYESILTELNSEAIWFYAVLDEKVIAMSIFLYANGKMHYHLSGSLTDYRNMAPTNLILYEAAMWACKQGIYSLHLGGGVGASNDSLYKFKKSFNREEDLTFCIGKKIYMQEVYNNLVLLRTQNDGNFNPDTSFFPKYRG